MKSELYRWFFYTYYSTLNETGKEGNPGKVSWSVPKRPNYANSRSLQSTGRGEKYVEKKKKALWDACMRKSLG